MLPLLLAFSPVAEACPTIATGTPNQLSFDTAVVAVVREGTRTTFSVAVNPRGEEQPFALVLPVPEVLEESEIRTLPSGIFAMLDGYTAPRRVSDAGCAAAQSYEGDADTDVDADVDDDGDALVDVEAEYLVGDYQITILSADESRALGTWLDTNGYHLPDGAEPRLAEYIDAGSYFLAAKVAEGATVADGSRLPPLQIAYDSDVFSIPIRLAALNSPGVQDMVIYTITDKWQGRVGIANYPEFVVPDGCRWGRATEDFGAFYEALYTKHWEAQGDAAWAVEYAGGTADCNPCTAEMPREYEIAALGYTGRIGSHTMTRIHFRYTPDQAGEDLVLYQSGITTPHSQSYADSNGTNPCIEACDGSEAAPEPEACGCGAPEGSALVVALAVARRRRARTRT